MVKARWYAAAVCPECSHRQVVTFSVDGNNSLRYYVTCSKCHRKCIEVDALPSWTNDREAARLELGQVMYPIAKARGLSLALDSPRHPGSECQPARCRSYSRMTRELATPPPNGYGDDSHPHGLKLTDETAGTIQTWGASS